MWWCGGGRCGGGEVHITAMEGDGGTPRRVVRVPHTRQASREKVLISEKVGDGGHCCWFCGYKEVVTDVDCMVMRMSVIVVTVADLVVMSPAVCGCVVKAIVAYDSCFGCGDGIQSCIVTWSGVCNLHVIIVW